MIKCYWKTLIIHFYFNREKGTEYVIEDCEIADNESRIGAPNTNHPEKRTPSSPSEHNDPEYEPPVNTPNNDSEAIVVIEMAKEVRIRNVMEENWIWNERNNRRACSLSYNVQKEKNMMMST